MSTWLRRLLVILLLAGAGVLAWSLWFRPEPVPVTVKRVERGVVEETVTNSRAGTLKTRRRASLSPERGGVVQELSARKGQTVAAGDVLIRLSNEEPLANVGVAQRAHETAMAREREACLAAEQAERDYARAADLARERILSEERLEQARLQRDARAAACEAAAAAVRQAQSSVGLARATSGFSVLRAPFAGVIADVRTEVGEFIAPSVPGVFIPPVIDLIDMESIYVSAPLDEVDVGQVRVGLPVRITLDPYPNRDFPGRVERIAPYVEEAREQSRTFEVEVEFDPWPGDDVVLLPGATADVEVILRDTEGVLRVPSYALLEGDRVLVVREDRLVDVKVEPGLRNWEYVEIRSGLEEGDPVVVSLDRAEVKAGAHVVMSEAGEADPT